MMKFGKFGATFCIFFLGVNSWVAGATVPAGAESTSQLDVAYGPDREEMLDLCMPADGRTTHPAVVIIHGGGWVAGDKSGMAWECKLFASKGYVSAAVDYRLFDPKSMRNQWPAQILDVQLAIRWLRVKSRQLGVDGSRICAYGKSSGAHLALFLGMVTKTWEGDRDTLYPEQSPSVACVVEVSGPTDLVSGSKSMFNKAKLFVPVNPGDTVENALRQASPITFVTSTAAPTLIVQGLTDDLVPKSQALILEQAFQKKGAPVQYLEHRGGHVYSWLTLEEKTALIAKELDFVASVIGH